MSTILSFDPYAPAEATMADEKTPARAAKPAAARPAAAKPAAPPPAKVDHEDDDTEAYGVIKESEEELRIAEKNKPKFTDVKDKFKRSLRGPAMALLVMPSNLLIAEGALTGLFGVGSVIVGIWPLVFTDAPPSDEEIAEQLVTIFVGLVAFTWGALICLGASRMQNLDSYAWALAGSVLGIFPLLAGIFAIIALRDPRVIAGFEEIEGAIDTEGEGEDDEDEEDDDEDDEDEDEDDDDEEDEDEDDEVEDKKARKKKR